VNVDVDVDGGGGNVELLFYGMAFPGYTKIITIKGMWVADIHVMTHITPHDDGMGYMVAPSASDIVTMGNGTCEGTKAVGNIPGMISDKNVKLEHWTR
jgi:hypothetical protein